MEEIRLTEKQYDEKAEKLFEEASTELERMAASKYLTMIKTELFPDSKDTRDVREIMRLKGLAGRIISEMAKDIEGREPDLKDTVEGMLSDDYRERFIAEYLQTKIRYKKLKKLCNRIETAQRRGMPEPKHAYSLEILRDQQK